jgi:hypothetical protein
MSHWTDLKPRKRILPWGRWRVLAKLWLEAKAKRRAELNESRLRSMQMCQRLSEQRQLK